MYPVASRNDKDFKNLMDVYLDAVFYPLIYENPYTLMQEGWHYEIAGKEGELAYNGVVYNEMKAYILRRTLLPKTKLCVLYSRTARTAMNPAAIRQQYRSLRRKRLKTSTAPIIARKTPLFICTAIWILKKTLEYLDGEYLSAFEKSGSVNSAIPLQQPFAKTKEVKAFYPAGADEDLAAKTYHELDIVCGDARDAKTSLALRLLETVLLEGNSAPLRLTLLESGICTDAYGQYTGSLRQPVFAVKVSGSEEDKRDEFISIVYRTLQKLTIEALIKNFWKPALTCWNLNCARQISVLILKVLFTALALWIPGFMMVTL